MKEFYPVLRTCSLFAGVDEGELLAMLGCLQAKARPFAKGDYLLRAGEAVETLGLVVEGSVLVSQEDFWGNRHVLDALGPGECYGESFACAPGSVSNVAVQARQGGRVLMISVGRLLTLCPATCAHHSRMVRNLLSDLAGKNLALNEKVTHMSRRTTRDKVLSFLSCQARLHGGSAFDIPFSRQQLADYLAVERSGLSQCISRLQREGIIRVDKQHFVLNIPTE